MVAPDRQYRQLTNCRRGTESLCSCGRERTLASRVKGGHPRTDGPLFATRCRRETARAGARPHRTIAAQPRPWIAGEPWRFLAGCGRQALVKSQDVCNNSSRLIDQLAISNADGVSFPSMTVSMAVGGRGLGSVRIPSLPEPPPPDQYPLSVSPGVSS